MNFINYSLKGYGRICDFKQVKTSSELSFAIWRMKGMDLESLGVHPAL